MSISCSFEWKCFLYFHFYFNAYYNMMQYVHLNPPLPLWDKFTHISLNVPKYNMHIYILCIRNSLFADFIAVLTLYLWMVERWNVDQNSLCYCEEFTWYMLTHSQPLGLSTSSSPVIWQDTQYHALHGTLAANATKAKYGVLQWSVLSNSDVTWLHKMPHIIKSLYWVRPTYPFLSSCQSPKWDGWYWTGL